MSLSSLIGQVAGMSDAPQGLIAPFIVVEEGLFNSDEPDALTEGIDAFAHWAVTQGMLVAGEFPPEAMWIENLDGYAGQVSNGGHTQFVCNTGLNPTTLRNVEDCLRAMDAREFLDIFLEFRRRLEASPELTRRALKAGPRDWPKEFDDLDGRFYALEKAERLVAQAGRWARTLPVVKPVPFEEVKQERERIVAANPMFEARRDAARRRREEAEAADPLYVAAKRLCTLAGIEFQRFTALSRGQAPVVLTAGLVTSDGLRFMVVQDGEARLLDRDRKPTPHACDCALEWPADARGPIEASIRRNPDPAPPAGGPATSPPRGSFSSWLGKLFGRRD
jgi:hypothetical protein